MKPPFSLVDEDLPKGTLLLEASAGTGKTYTITGLVLRLLLEEPRKKLDQILVVTFTRAATQELKNRVRKALQDGLRACEHGGHAGDPFLDHLGKKYGKDGARVLRTALQEADGLAISTIHGFCKRVLDESAFASAMPFQADFVDDESHLLLAAAEDAVRLEVQTRNAGIARLCEQNALLPEHLVGHYRNWKRHPGTVILPAARAIDEVLAERDAAVHAIGELLARNDMPRDELAQIPWLTEPKAKWIAPKLGDGLVDALAEAARAGTPRLDVYVELAPSGFAGFVGKQKRPPLDHAFFAHCDRVARAERDLAHALRSALLHRMHERLGRQKSTAHCMSFHDLLTELAAALRDPVRGPRMRASVATRFQVAVVDEFQDTDPLQYEVFHTCFAEGALYLVGDPKQSIYGFRGADVQAYLRAAADAKHHYSLGKNHRSHPDLVRAVGHLFCGPAAFATKGIEHAPVEPARTKEECATIGFEGPTLQFRCVDARTDGASKEGFVRRIAVDVADACARFLAEPEFRTSTQIDDAKPARVERIRPRDLAVLTRSNDEAQLVQDELRARGIPSAIGKAGNVFECPEFDDVRLLLLALTAPSRTLHLNAALSTALFGLTIDDLEANAHDEAAQSARLERIDAYRRTWLRHGWLAMFEELLAEERVRERLLRRADGERKLTNYLHLAELLHRAEHDEHRTGEGLLAWLLQNRDRSAALDREERELRLESDADAVQILTSHGAKGLQFEIVFVPFAWTGRKPPPDSTPLLARDENGRHVLDFGTEPEVRARHLASFLHDQLAEDLRLLYVALTRARRRCFVHLAPNKLARWSGLGWLLLGPGRGTASPTQALEAAWRAGRGPDGTDLPEPDADAWRAAAETLAHTSGGTIGAVRVAGDDPVQGSDRTARTERPAARLRSLPAHLPEGFAVTSFTSLCRGDREAHATTDAGADDPLAASSSGLRADEPTHDKPTPQSADAPPEGLFAFARGAAAGTCLHQLLELADLRRDRASLHALATTVLHEHGLDRDGAHRTAIDAPAVATDLLVRLATQDLAPLPFRLRELAPTDKAAEWRFFAAAGRIVPSGLADVFSAHASDELRGYADRLAGLSPRAIAGFLTGSIDLLAMHDGRAFVFDWKSNWLGDRHDDYSRERLLVDVQQNDYVLQYHLYVLAVHRHLRARVRDYDYDRCVGDVAYVYLRGLGDGATGLFCDRPSRAMVEALDRWLSGVRGGER